MLDDDRDVGFNDRGIIRADRDRFGVIELVETQMEGPALRNLDEIGDDRLANDEK